VGLLFSKKKIAFRNFKNSLMLIYTFRFEKLKNKASFRRKNWRKYTQKKIKNIAEGYRENRALTELPIMCFS